MFTHALPMVGGQVSASKGEKGLQAKWTIWHGSYEHTHLVRVGHMQTHGTNPQVSEDSALMAEMFKYTYRLLKIKGWRGGSAVKGPYWLRLEDPPRFGSKDLCQAVHNYLEL